MGIIQRQGAKNTIVGFVGVLIGGLATIFIYGWNKESYGYVQWLYGTANFLLPFTSLGVVTLVMKFYPKFKTDDGKDCGFIWMMLSFYTAAFAIFLILFWIFRDQLFGLLRLLEMDRGNRLDSNISYILVLSFLVGIIMIFVHHSSNYKRIVVPEIINNLSYKIYLAALILLVAAGVVSLGHIPFAIIGFFCLIVVGLFIYLGSIGGISNSPPKWQSISGSLRREMTDYSLFGALNTMGSVLAFRIDIIMIGIMLGYEAVGLYSILLFFANVIEIPTRAISKIASPIISKSLETNDLDQIRMIYKKSSLNLILAGIPIFLLIWFSLPDLERLASGENNFLQGKYVFLCLAGAKLMDMLFSVNSQIIQYSKDYRYILLFMLVLAGVNIYLNYTLINEYGIIGAALASVIAFSIFNVLKFSLLHFRWRMQPFTGKTAVALLTGGLMFAILYFLPKFDIAPLNIIATGLLIVLIYCPIIFFSRISDDINQTVVYFLGMVKGRIIK